MENPVSSHPIKPKLKQSNYHRFVMNHKCRDGCNCKTSSRVAKDKRRRRPFYYNMISTNKGQSSSNEDLACYESGVWSLTKKQDSCSVKTEPKFKSTAQKPSKMPDKKKLEPLKINEYLIDLKTNTPKKGLGFYCWHAVSILIVFALILNPKCLNNFDINDMKEALNAKIYGQAEAVELLANALEIEGSKLLILYGSTGVGKTYAVSNIFNNYWNNCNVFHYTMNAAKTFDSRIFLSTIYCRHAIFVVDDLGVNDFNIVPKVNTMFEDHSKLAINVTMILIYNCDEVHTNFKKSCDDEFTKKIKKEFTSVYIVRKEYIKFQPLKQEHLIKCIDDALGETQLDEHKYENLLHNFNVEMDGCKGVQPKVQLLKANQ